MDDAQLEELLKKIDHENKHEDFSFRIRFTEECVDSMLNSENSDVSTSETKSEVTNNAFNVFNDGNVEQKQTMHNRTNENVQLPSEHADRSVKANKLDVEISNLEVKKSAPMLKSIKEENKDTIQTDNDNDAVEQPVRANDEHCKPIGCHGVERTVEQCSYENVTREEVVARYQLLCKIEKVEDEIAERMKDMNNHLDG